MPDEIIPDDHRADGAVAGFHFGVASMKGENFIPPQHYSEIENTSELPLAAVHLAWLAVGDQEGHNQYLQELEVRREGFPPTARKRFRLVDMGQMFGNFEWNADTVKVVHDRYKLPPHLAEKLTLEKLAPAISALKSVGDSSIRASFEDCPDEWNVPAADREAGAERALSAKDRIEEIIRKGNPAIS